MNTVPPMILGKATLLEHECTDIRKPRFISDHSHETLPSVEELEAQQKQFTWPKEFYFAHLHTGDENVAKKQNVSPPSESSDAKEEKTINKDDSKEDKKPISQDNASPVA